MEFDRKYCLKSARDIRRFELEKYFIEDLYIAIETVHSYRGRNQDVFKLYEELADEFNISQHLKSYETLVTEKEKNKNTKYEQENNKTLNGKFISELLTNIKEGKCTNTNVIASVVALFSRNFNEKDADFWNDFYKNYLVGKDKLVAKDKDDNLTITKNQNKFRSSKKPRYELTKKDKKAILDSAQEFFKNQDFCYLEPSIEFPDGDNCGYVHGHLSCNKANLKFDIEDGQFEFSLGMLNTKISVSLNNLIVNEIPNLDFGPVLE